MLTIVTDSTAYYKKDEAAAGHIKVVPMGFSVDGKTFHETFSDQNGSFESLIRSGENFATSHPNPAAYLSCFEEELAAGHEVLCVTVSSRLSGAYSAAHMAAKQTGSEKVAVFDSRLTAGGLRLLIKQAGRLAAQNLPLPDIIRGLIPLRDKIHIVFSVDDMAPLRNSGRIGFVRQGVGTILNMRPILLCTDGVVVYDSVARGTLDMIKKMMAKVPEHVGEIIINYIDNSRAAANLYNVIAAKLPGVPISLQKVGPVLGIHLGLGAVGVSYITK